MSIELRESKVILVLTFENNNNNDGDLQLIPNNQILILCLHKIPKVLIKFILNSLNTITILYLFLVIYYFYY